MISFTHTSNLLVGGHSADESGPEAGGYKVRHPEPVQGWLIQGLHLIQQGDITQDIVGFGIGGSLGHQGRDDHLVAVDLQGYFKLLQKGDVAVLHVGRDVPLGEQSTDLSYA